MYNLHPGQNTIMACVFLFIRECLSVERWAFVSLFYTCAAYQVQLSVSSLSLPPVPQSERERERERESVLCCAGIWPCCVMLKGIKGMGVLPTAAKQHYPTQNNRRASCARETLAKITHTETEKRRRKDQVKSRRVENTRVKNIERSLAKLIMSTKANCVRLMT